MPSADVPNIGPHGSTSMDKQYTKFQQRAIKNFYDNREAISLQRLSELVTELHLAEGTGRERQSNLIAAALKKLCLPDQRTSHLQKKHDPKRSAKLVE